MHLGSASTPPFRSSIHAPEQRSAATSLSAIPVGILVFPVINIVLPVFGIVAAGYLCGRRGLLGEDASTALNLFVYWIALPALLFKAMATIELASVFNFAFLAGFGGALAILWIVAIVLSRVLFRLTLAQAALHGMNGVYANTGYIGIPLAVTAFGEEAALPAIIATVINTAFVVGLAIVLIETGNKRGGSPSGLFRTVALRMAGNPMLSAPVLGLLYAATGLHLPTPATTFLSLLAAAAGPCALFSIGLFMVGKPQSAGLLEVGAMTMTKLVLHPILTALFVLALIPNNALWAKVAILMAALPTGTGSYVLAQAYGEYVLRTSSAILLTTLLSVVSVAVFFLVFPPHG